MVQENIDSKHTFMLGTLLQSGLYIHFRLGTFNDLYIWLVGTWHDGLFTVGI